MRRVAQHVAALAQGVEDQRQVHLLEIAHAAMHELGAAAGGFFGEVGTLYKQRAVAASGGFHRCTQASGPAADDQHVPRLRCSAQLVENFLPCDHASHFLSIWPDDGKQHDLRRSTTRRTGSYVASLYAAFDQEIASA